MARISLAQRFGLTSYKAKNRLNPANRKNESGIIAHYVDWSGVRACGIKNLYQVKETMDRSKVTCFACKKMLGE